MLDVNKQRGQNSHFPMKEVRLDGVEHFMNWKEKRQNFNANLFVLYSRRKTKGVDPFLQDEYQQPLFPEKRSLDDPSNLQRIPHHHRICAYDRNIRSIWTLPTLSPRICIQVKHWVAYIVALGLISSAELVSSGIYYFLKKGVAEDLFSSVNAARELESYDLDEGVASRWDGLHRRYECCGAYTTGNGNTDWNRVRYGSVPDSCCIEEYSGCGGDVLATTNDQNLPIDSLIYVEGCLTVLQRVLHLEILPIISALSFLTLLSALIQLFLVLFTTCIIRNSKTQSDEDEIITMSEVIDDSSQYPSYVQRGHSYKNSIISSSFPNQEDPSIPCRKKSVGCCPCFWRRNFVEYDEEPIQGDSFHNQFRLKQLTDWEAIEREEMLMSVLDSVMMSRRNSDVLRKSDKNVFPDKYTNTGHPPINRVVVREGSVPKPARISLHSKEEINSISKKVNFSHDNLLQSPTNHYHHNVPKKRFLSDFALPRYQDKSTSCADEEIPFPPNKTLRRKRLSLPSNINLKKSKSDIASEYLTMDYEEMIIHPGQSSSKVIGKTRKLSETQSNERERNVSNGYISPARECSTINRDEIIEEITVEEKDLQRNSLSEKDKQTTSKTNIFSSKPLLESRRNRHQRTQSSSGKPNISKDKDKSSEYDTKTSPPIQRKISFSISPYEEGKPVHRLYQRKHSKESESPLNHDKMYSIVFDDHKESSKQNEKFKKTHLRSRSVHEAPSSKSNSPTVKPCCNCRNPLPKTKKVSTADKSSNTHNIFKSMDSIRKGSTKSHIDDILTLSSSLDNQNPIYPFPVHSILTQRENSSSTPKRKLDIFSGGSIRSRSSQRRNPLKRGQIVRGRSHDTIASLPPPSTVPRKYSLKTSEL
ncbi:CD63 [Lepeophtheirus salmonis]|uniref:CD63 n=1 Tax=Lepeophtheirus salmonis TaxID=72036 RepID=A0A7R8H0G7_LEPSM|nr:CD63 [Lepeophtheirus salmonis]CAF2768285.1 CD63 [Lepeophtheirus salmonis]